MPSSHPHAKYDYWSRCAASKIIGLHGIHKRNNIFFLGGQKIKDHSRIAMRPSWPVMARHVSEILLLLPGQERRSVCMTPTLNQDLFRLRSTTKKATCHLFLFCFYLLYLFLSPSFVLFPPFASVLHSYCYTIDQNFCFMGDEILPSAQETAGTYKGLKKWYWPHA